MFFNIQHAKVLPGLTAKLLTILVLSSLQACFSPMALDYSVIEYDKTTTNILSKQLLLNIARSHQHQPIHFTGVSNIAATFNFQFNAGATPALTGELGSLITPIFGGSISENPTISVVPIEGEEFTRRLLTPFQENKLTMLLRQGVPVDLLLRLLANQLRMFGDEQVQVYTNIPSHVDGYSLFRQVVLHLSSIQDKQQLFAEPLMFIQSWTLPVEALDIGQIDNLQKDYIIDYQSDKKLIKLTKREFGRVLLTNYDPSTLSNDERFRLNQEANKGLDNDVMVDIRPGFPGGDWPIHGFFRLRSFNGVLNFIGQSINEIPEFDVPRPPQSVSVRDNPVKTLGLTVTRNEPYDSDLNIKLGDYYYALEPETGYQWNRNAFRLLYQIFQMTMTDLGRQGAPSITIAK